METINIFEKRSQLKPGTYVNIFSDDWSLANKQGIMLDPSPIEDSTQCIVEIDGEAITLPIHDVFVQK